MTWLLIKLLIQSQKFQKIWQENNSETVTNEQDKEMYLQKKDKKLLVNWDQNSIMMEYQNITKVSKGSQQNNSQTVPNDNDKNYLKKRYVSPEERQKIMGNLRSMIIIQ